MMAQNGLVVVGIDVAKDKVDACIRMLAVRQRFPSSAQGKTQPPPVTSFAQLTMLYGREDG